MKRSDRKMRWFAAAAGVTAVSTLLSTSAFGVVAHIPLVPGMPGNQNLISTGQVADAHGIEQTIVSDGNGHLYVGVTNGTVYRINTNGTGFHQIDSGLTGFPLFPGLALGPDGNLWEGDSTHGRIKIVNPATGTMVGSFPTGFAPTAIVFDGLGHVFVASNSDEGGNGEIVRYNLDGSGKAVLETGGDPWGLAYDNGHLFWPDGYASGDGWRMNTDGSNKTVVISGTGTLEGVMVLKDHNVLWSSYGDDVLYETSPASNSPALSLGSVTNAENCVQDAQSSDLYCATWFTGLLHVNLSPKVMVGTTSAVVSWSASSSGSLPTETYTVTAAPLLGGDSITQVVPASQLSTTFYGLSSGAQYRFNVFASNANGDSATNNTMIATPGPQAPNAPTGVSALRLSSGAKVSWAPSVTNGAPVSAYLVTTFKADGSGDGYVVASRVSVPGSQTTVSVGGLINGKPYRVMVTALSTAGNSQSSAPSPTVVPAGPPSWSAAPVATALSKAAKVQWSAANANGAAVTSYKVTAYPSGKTCVTAALSCTVAGLSPGVTYAFKVTATNQYGSSAPSPTSNSVVVKA